MTRAHLFVAGRATRALVASALIGSVAAPAAATAAVGTRAQPAAAPCHRACLAQDLRVDLRTYLRARGGREHVSASSLTLRFPGPRETVSVAAGRTRFGGTQPVRPSSVWQIGSNTKAFTSVILLQLEAQHRLSINDTLGKWLPRYKQWSDVTIKQLLNMTSGIPTYDNSPAWLHAFAANPHRNFTPRALVRYAMPGTPTTGYSYSNTNYVLGEMIIQKVTQHSYRHELQARIIRPLHLHHLYYRSDTYPRSVTRREPAGYFFNTQTPGFSGLMGRDVSRTTLSWARGAGGIIATTRAMTVWEHALYGGSLLPAQQEKELLSLVSVKTGKPIKHTTPGDPEGFGLGVAQLTTPQTGRIWYYEGETLGFRTLHMYLPKSGLIVAMGLNSQPTVDRIGMLALGVYRTLKADGALP